MFDFIRSIQLRDPARPTFFEVVLAYPGFHIMTFFHPVAGFLWRLRLKALARIWANVGRLITGIEIHPEAKIGKNLFIDHGMGTVFGQTAVIGDNCTIYHGVTLGGRGKSVDGPRRHPWVGNDVVIGAGAQIIGAIRLGHQSRVGAGAVVTKDVEDGVTVVGNPARPVNVAPSDVGAYGLPEGECLDVLSDKITELEVQLTALCQEKK